MDFPFPPHDGLRINFDNSDVEFIVPEDRKVCRWLEHIIEIEGGNVSELNYVFCSDKFLHKMNVDYLGHDTLTDIITFPINDDPIQSDIFISIDRVGENALDRSLSFDEELHRVMVHGLLHLLGYADKTEQEKVEMRSKENYYLDQINF